MNTQTFLIRCEYPDGDHIPTQEFVENIQEYFASNIMDGERGRLVVKPVYQPREEGLYKTESRIPTISQLFYFVSLVKRMREAQNCWWDDTEIFVTDEEVDDLRLRMEQLESEVDEYLKKMDV